MYNLTFMILIVLWIVKKQFKLKKKKHESIFISDQHYVLIVVMKWYNYGGEYYLSSGSCK